MNDAEIRAAAINLAPLDGKNLEDDAIDYLIELIRTAWEVSELRKTVSKVKLTRTGYQTQTELTNIESDYRELIDRVDSLREALFTQRVSSVEGLNSINQTAQNQFLTFIDDGTIPDEIHKVEQSLTMVGQQLNSKTIAANSRMGITISLVAAGIALLSVFASVLF